MKSLARTLDPCRPSYSWAINQNAVPEKMATIRAEVGMDVDVIMAPVRVSDIAIPRLVAMYLCRELTHAPYGLIAAWWERDRTTAMYAARVIPGYADKDPEFAARLQVIRAACEAALNDLN
jgi:chromosomal replication initiation ATPase DnaA